MTLPQPLDSLACERCIYTVLVLRKRWSVYQEHDDIDHKSSCKLDCSHQIKMCMDAGPILLYFLALRSSSKEQPEQ